jgi:hypothetical protein
MSKIFNDPEVLGLRVSAKLGGEPFNVVLDIKNRRDALVLEGSGRQAVLTARRDGQPATEFRSWGASEFADLDPMDALAKMRTSINSVTVCVVEADRSLRTVVAFDGWDAFVAWLGDAAGEEVHRFTIDLPGSLYLALQKLALRRKEAGGRGTVRDVLIAAAEEYLDSHGT